MRYNAPYSASADNEYSCHKKSLIKNIMEIIE